MQRGMFRNMYAEKNFDEETTIDVLVALYFIL
jgi:hypothetical protein